jgi:hypothetical protein
MTQQINKCKFRISISQEQMQFILACPDCPADLRRIIEVALVKAGNGYVKPAFEVKTDAAKLAIDKQYRMALDYLDRGQPIPQHIIAGYEQYRYENDLMSEEELADYEKAAGF